MARLRVETVHGPARRAIFKGLRAFNAPHFGKLDYKPLTITVREGKDIIGGLSGQTALGWLYVELLWVSDGRRRKGLGRALMTKAEAEARKRGARNAWLDTFSFQAPPFYRKLGYKEFGRLDDFPAGRSRHWMTKAL
jgi:GNAT superfamily N-acetyltransferase